MVLLCDGLLHLSHNFNFFHFLNFKFLITNGTNTKINFVLETDFLRKFVPVYSRLE